MKLYLRRILNLALWLTVCFLGGTGAVLFWRLPPGSRGGQGLSLWGLSRHDWGDIHAIAGLVFVVLIVAHLWLAWAWLKNAAANRRLWPVLGGLAVGVAIPVVMAFAPVQKNAGAGDVAIEHAESAPLPRPGGGQGGGGQGIGKQDGSGPRRQGQ